MSQLNKKLRIVVYGAECSGKTTLSEKLAQHFNFSLCQEFSREFAEAQKRALTYEDVMPIALGQELNERKAILKATSTIFDTNLIQTAVYSDIYYGKIPDELHSMIDEERYDYYLFCLPVKPWKQDGIRGDIISSEEMHHRFELELNLRGISAVFIEGNEYERYAMAIKAISDWLKLT